MVLVWGIVLATLTTLTGPLAGQRCSGCEPLDALEPCKFKLKHLQRYQRLFPGPDSDRYLPPDDQTIESIAGSIQAMVEGDATTAFEAALLAGYLVCRVKGSDGPIAVWRPMLVHSGQAFLAIRPAPKRDLIISIPHPVYDQGTLRQGLGAFEQLSARALIVAGTHRCANTREGDCNGTTGVCVDGVGRYRESDMAHVERSIFHHAHRVLTQLYLDDVVLSLHGMGHRGLVVSDGTTSKTSTDTPVAQLYLSLRESFPKERVLSCNESDAIPEVALCGTSNIQGQYLNAGQDRMCTATASIATGRFLHLEQSRQVRRRWPRVIEAVSRVLRER